MISTSKNVVNCQNALKSQRKFEDFQAEYEGSIPFTRSNLISSLLRIAVAPGGAACALLQLAM
ncbi:hypothetical protein H8A99_16480 [Bradyrhizobium sp. Arg68]|uniref:hypothetical protein n=1 Tax=Bradyrhizobium ivorense TaxID=2511166 RepID=UPI001E3DCEC0|nr:hypothetical protein [Bradyrhizobium ivorense]MCC8938024.1 hypothetical protein [Bradyrhizobium ivorense]